MNIPLILIDAVKLRRRLAALPRRPDRNNLIHSPLLISVSGGADPLSTFALPLCVFAGMPSIPA